MNATTYLLCFVAGLLGMTFHIFAIKIPAVKKQATVANMGFSYGAYLKDDLAAILASLLTILILLVVLDEVVKFKPEVLSYLKFFFVCIGYMGSSVLISVMGQAVSKINSVVDLKTNISDALQPPVSSAASIKVE